MDNFTNSGLTDLLVKIAGRHDPDMVSGVATIHPMTRGIQPDTPKRQIIERVLEKHGPGMLLSVGRHLRDNEPTPTFTALTQTLEPSVIAAKWIRLERYNHASHRTRIGSDGPGHWSCVRTSQSTPATPGENYLIAGVLFGLLSLTGVRNPTLHLGGQALTLSTLEKAERQPDTTADRFIITWDPSGPETRLAEKETSASHTTSRRLAGLLSQDLARGWCVAEAARALGKSDRTLQRELRREGNSYSTVMRRARMTKATQMLAAKTPRLAEIGYCCGYADQAHFQRDFLTAANVTPRQYIRVLNSGART